MVWPLIVFGVGVSALATRQGVRALRRANIRAPAFLSAFRFQQFRKNVAGYTRNLQGFDTPMSVTEACKILNVTPATPRDKVIQAHRNLMLRNHPDNGGSNFVASKVNEAKEMLVGNSKRS